MPLLAPGGTVITVIAPTTTVPLNSEIEIVVTVIENGTAAPPPATPGTPTTARPAHDADGPNFYSRGGHPRPQRHCHLLYDDDRPD